MGKLKTFLRELSLPPTQSHEAIPIGLHSLLNGFSGPAAFFDPKGKLIEANDKGNALLLAINDNRDCARNLALLIARANMTHEGSEVRISVPPPQHVLEQEGEQSDIGISSTYDGGVGRCSYDIFLTPWNESEGGILLFARDATAEANFASALSASRELYKDLIDCSADFAWETDAQGSFTYVTKQGALGYTAAELNGRKANTLFLPNDVHYSVAACPFLSPEPIREQEVVLYSKEGKAKTFLISAVPTLSKNGLKCGTRGIARDVSDLRAQEAEIESARRRETAVTQVMRAIHSQMDPLSILEAAADATLDASETFLCCVYRTRNSYFQAQAGYAIESVFGSARKDTNSFKVRPELQHLVPHLQQAATQNNQNAHILINNWHFLIEFTYHSGEINGAVAVALPKADKTAWPDEIASLLESIGEQVGLAIAHVNQTEALREMSRKDFLTGLLNRRAFHEETERALQNHIRHKREGALIYCDLDNFKTINDKYGHEEGDHVLIAFSELLKRKIRKGDLIVRFGGDEFGIWLSETPQVAACNKAEELLRELENDTALGAAPYPIGCSLGIATFAPNSFENLDELISRADRALYEAKSRGKNCWTLATLPARQNVKKEAAIC